MTNQNESMNEERRRYFRIHDDINFYYKVISDPAEIKTSYVNNDILSSCSLEKALDLITQDSKLTLTRIEQREPELGRYLAVLNTKIDLLAQAMQSLRADATEFQTRNVSLSASGVAFDSTESLSVDTLLEIKMVLSSLTGVIIAYANVVYCKPNSQANSDTHPYIIGVDYVNLQENERESIIRHMLKKQMQQIREQKESS